MLVKLVAPIALLLVATGLTATAGVPTIGANQDADADVSGHVIGMIAEARRIVRLDGDSVWPTFSNTRTPIMVVLQGAEVLFCAHVAAGFSSNAPDMATGCSVQRGRRDVPMDVSAATEHQGHFVVEIGLPDTLKLSRAEWIVTVLHEIFHGYQQSIPGYRAATARVGNDLKQTSSDWMLTYPFPYADPQVGSAIDRMCQAAMAFLMPHPANQDRKLIQDYVAARQRASKAVGEHAWRYYEFQVGQEGVARWTELALARRAEHMDRDVASVANDRQAGLATSLMAMQKQGVAIWKRSIFYVLGAVEAEMLDKTTKDWKREYRYHPFQIGAQLEQAAK